MLTSGLQAHRHTCAHLQTHMNPHKYACNVRWTQGMGPVGSWFEKRPKQGQGQWPRDPPHPGGSSSAGHQRLVNLVYSQHLSLARGGSACVSGLVLIPVGVCTRVGTLEHERPFTPSTGGHAFPMTHGWNSDFVPSSVSPLPVHFQEGWNKISCLPP